MICGMSMVEEHPPPGRDAGVRPDGCEAAGAAGGLGPDGRGGATGPGPDDRAAETGLHPDGRAAETGLRPEDLSLALRVLAAAERLPIEHPDAVAIQRATASLYKTVKRRRRSERRGAIAANDEEVTQATATGADGRIDDETQGLRLRSPTVGASAGTLMRARACYVCKRRYCEVDAFYHQLCPDCAARHHTHREARTDLRGRRALLTGGRAKIGMYIALRLLRDGAAHDDHDALPAGRGEALCGDGRQRRWLRSAADRRHRPAGPVAGRGTRRDGLGGAAAGHPDQQRRADGAPFTGAYSAARRGRGGAAGGGWDRRRRSSMLGPSRRSIRPRWPQVAPV